MPPASLRHSFQITALGPGVCVTFCVPFKAGVSISQSSGSPEINPTGLQSQTFWGLVFPVRNPQLGNVMWGSAPLLFGQNPCNCNYSPVCGSITWGCGIDNITICPSYPFPCGSLSLFFIHGCSVNSCKFGVTLRRGELRIFHPV